MQHLVDLKLKNINNVFVTCTRQPKKLVETILFCHQQTRDSLQPKNYRHKLLAKGQNGRAKNDKKNPATCIKQGCKYIFFSFYKWIWINFMILKCIQYKHVYSRRCKLYMFCTFVHVKESQLGLYMYVYIR